MKLKIASAAAAVAGLTAFAVPMTASTASAAPVNGSSLLSIVIGQPTTCLPTLNLGIVRITLCL